MRLRTFAIPLAAALAASLAIGCRVDEQKHGNGDDVHITTPFGGMHVRTDDASVTAGLDLPVYPGAQLEKSDKDSNHSADVSMGFGGYHLRVKAAGFTTSDPPEKVEKFYRDNMRRFGDVIACRNNAPIGQPTKTLQGLTCEDDHNHQNGNGHTDSHDLQLKAGSEQYQHIVDISPDGAGSKFGLVALELPTGNSENDDTRQ